MSDERMRRVRVWEKAMAEKVCAEPGCEREVHWLRPRADGRGDEWVCGEHRFKKGGGQ